MRLLLQAVLVSTMFLECTAVERSRESRSDEKDAGPANNRTQGKKMNELQINQPTLTVAFSADEKGVRVTYSVKNTTQTPIYLFNVIWDFDKTGNYVKAPQPAYVSLDGKNVLNVGKIIHPLPRSQKVELRIIPFGTKVEPGKEFSETVELKAPVEEYNPYFAREVDSTTEERKSSSARFFLHFTRQSDALDIKPAPLGKALLLSPPNLGDAIETLSSRPQPLEVVVNKRTDNFEPFGE